jgi:hypothetical protein
MIQSKTGATLLVLLGFACWFAASSAIPESSEWHFVATFAIAGLAFFVIGCFLPEYRQKRFILGRHSVLQLMAFHFWLSGTALTRSNSVKTYLGSDPLMISLIVFGSIAFAFASYYGAIYLIRGFRSPMEYADTTGL